MDRSIIARAQEFIARSASPITSREALKQALAERYASDPEGLLNFAVDGGVSAMRDLRKRTYDLPEQPGLFDLPPVIGISTPLGDLFIHLDDATAGQVGQWAREGEQHHGSQHKRFKAIRGQIKESALDPSENFKAQLRAIGGGDEK